MNITIDGKLIHNTSQTYIIAEISCNHKQQLRKAIQLIEQAKWAGADAVKMQVYYPQDMTIKCRNPLFKLKNSTPWEGEYLHDLYVQGSTPYPWASQLSEVAKKVGITLFSSVFSVEAVDFLEEHVRPPAYKVGSFEISHGDLLLRLVETKKPIIVSTGIANMWEITRVDKILSSVPHIFLKCSSTYPTSSYECNLLNIDALRSMLHCDYVGLSDHTSGINTAIASVALGAKVIEKHIKLDEAGKSLDDSFSLVPKKFREMVYGVREVEMALGSSEWTLTTGQKEARQELGRSIFVVEDMEQGDVFTLDNIKVIRPGHGMDPWKYHDIIGRKITRHTSRGTPLTQMMVG